MIPFNGTPHLALIKDAYLLIYLGLAIDTFYKFKRIMKFNYSSNSTNNIEWLKKFLFSFLSLMLFDFLVTLYELLFGSFAPWDAGYTTAVILIILGIYLGYKGIKQSMITIPDLTLSYLAKFVGPTNRKLSIVLNHGLCISFYDFINGHRIDAVKEKIRSEAYDNFSILGIAYDASFKSKSSFYRIFKKETSISPAEYKKKLSPKK